MQPDAPGMKHALNPKASANSLVACFHAALSLLLMAGFNTSKSLDAIVAFFLSSVALAVAMLRTSFLSNIAFSHSHFVTYQYTAVIEMKPLQVAYLSPEYGYNTFS